MTARDFEDLDVYKVAREFRKEIYALTRELPAQEKFVLVPQMRRAALSATSNIAEGHGTYTHKQSIDYLHRSRGSVYELRDHLNACADENYADPARIKALQAKAVRLIRVIDGYVRYLRSRQSDDG